MSMGHDANPPLACGIRGMFAAESEAPVVNRVPVKFHQTTLGEVAKSPNE